MAVLGDRPRVVAGLLPKRDVMEVTSREGASKGHRTATMSFPSGISETGINLRFAIASGIPMIVMAIAIAMAIVCQRAGAEHRPGIREPAGARRELSYHSVRTL